MMPLATRIQNLLEAVPFKTLIDNLKHEDIQSFYLTLSQWRDQAAQMAEDNHRLRLALIAHRQDLHGYSRRPCGTCRKSAEALKVADKVPNTCADWRVDKNLFPQSQWPEHIGK